MRPSGGNAAGDPGGRCTDGEAIMRATRSTLLNPILVATVAAVAMLPAAGPASATGPGPHGRPLRARVTGAVIPGSQFPVDAAGSSGLPSRKQQIKVLKA